jgi:hypothetical protein
VEADGVEGISTCLGGLGGGLDGLLGCSKAETNDDYMIKSK